MNQYGVNDDVTKSIDKVQEEVRDYVIIYLALINVCLHCSEKNSDFTKSLYNNIPVLLLSPLLLLSYCTTLFGEITE